MPHQVNVEVGGRTLTLETGKIARQANGAVVARYGDTVVLVAACMDTKTNPKDFLPLTVDYREYTYSAGKIPGGFFKREGRPSEREILTSRQIDRPLRPLFPESWRNETQVVAMVLSADSENDPDVIAICGASAALAIASILPKHKNAERDASFTVIGVTALSTLAMILYPIAVGALGWDHHATGIFLGATIHDVAQVVGAGYSLSQDTGDTATIVKLLRVAMLLPVCVAIGLALHVRGSQAAHAAPVLPGFAVAFAILVGVASMGWIPPALAEAGSVVSRWFLVTAIAAIGMKTSLKSLVDMGVRPVLLVVAETVFLAVLVLGVLTWN